MSARADMVRGGRCPALIGALVEVLKGDTRHVSTSGDIDSSRLVSVHICDRCRVLFVPDGTPKETL